MSWQLALLNLYTSGQITSINVLLEATHDTLTGMPLLILQVLRR